MEEKAIILIEIDESGKCKVNKEALKIIDSISAPVSAVCVAGKYRTGKSFLLNRLLNRQDGFKIGSTTQPCTKGIWMWSRPVEADGSCALLLDTEGLYSCNRDAQIDTKIFTIAVLLCSFLIYNTTNSIDENAIEALSFVTNLSNYIHVKTKNPSIKEDPSEFAQFFPYFLWVVRDFNLKLLTTEKQYLENALRPTDPIDENAEKKNKIRDSISSYFKERDCITMVRPVNSEEELRVIDSISYDKLKGVFREQAQKLVNKVYGKLRPKVIDGVSLNGRMYATMVVKYVNELNSDSLPTILTTWDQIIESEANTLATNANRTYEDGLLKVESMLPVEESILRAELYKIKANALAAFSNQELQGNHIYNSYQAKMIDKIRGKEEEIYSVNRKKSEDTSRVMLSECLETFNINLKPKDLSMRFIAESIDKIRKSYYSLAQGPAKFEIYDQLMNPFTFNLFKRLLDLQEDAFTLEVKKVKSDLSREEGINKARQSTLELQKKQYDEQNKEAQERYKKEMEANEASLKQIISSYEDRLKQAQAQPKIVESGGKKDSTLAAGTANDMIKFILDEIKNMKISVETNKIKAEYERYKHKLIKDCDDKIISVKQTEKNFYNNILDSLKISICINEGRLNDTLRQKNEEISELKGQLQADELQIGLLTKQLQDYEKERDANKEQAAILIKLTETLVQYIGEHSSPFL